MIKHSQYFTTEIYSSALVSTIDLSNVTSVIDLGIGDGALSYASLQRWPDAKITAFDIDDNICTKYTKEPQIEAIQEDVLSENFDGYNQEGTYDLAICNPPFINVKKEKRFESIFEKANLADCQQLKQLSADLLFLTQNLILLKDGGCCAIILPDGPLTRVDYKPFRKALLTNYKVTRIVELPEKSFQKTEARTHILIIHKQKPVESTTELSLMDDTGKIVDSIICRQDELINRLDYSYNKWKLNITNEIHQNNKMSLFIKRGSFTYKDLRKLDCQYIHSNSYYDGEILAFDSLIGSHYNNKVIGVAGDIIMCRVGKRCVGKIAYIDRGEVVLSDCLYKITVPKEKSKQVFKVLNGIKCKEWIRIASHGVCSKVISKAELIEYIQTHISTDI